MVEKLGNTWIESLCIFLTVSGFLAHTRHPVWLCFCLLLESLLQTTPRHSHPYLFFIIIIFGCAGSSPQHSGFLQLQRARAALRLRRTGFSPRRPLLLQSTRSRPTRFSSCGHWFVVSSRVESFWTRDRACIRRIARQILPHCTTREVCLQHLEVTKTK